MITYIYQTWIILFEKVGIFVIKLGRDFFTDKEVLFVGYSSRNPAYSKNIYQAFINGGIKVYPINNKDNASYDIKVYKSPAEIQKVPRTAFVLLNKSKTPGIVRPLFESGVKRILFRSVDPEALKLCDELGIEAATGCPLMLLGSGLHRFHGFISGVRR